MAELMYKPFHETYKIISFALCIGLVYPNKGLQKVQLIYISIVLISVQPILIMVCIDVHKSWTMGDVVNIIRHVTVTLPLGLVFFKMILLFYKRVEAAELVSEINTDYASYNNFNQEYRAIVSAGIRNSRIYTETCWTITVFMCVLIFPLMAIALNIYNFTFKFEATKHMVHDLNRPFSEPEERFESPYYEIMFFYMFYCCIFYVIYFIGYDGFFGVCINHACMKVELISKLLTESLKTEDVHKSIAAVIKEQNRFFRFVAIIQDTFYIWLGFIYIANMIQICACLYHIAEGYGFDLTYTIFIIGTVIHIYLPCHYAAKLKAMSLEMATATYRCGWENVSDVRIRKMLVFMIARVQKSLQITIFKVIIFDMKLFTSMMQASYSLYTLLRS